MQEQELEPLWDEGISSLLEGEYARVQKPLTMQDLRGYANEHAVRIGDILETLFLMGIYGDWKYTDANGEEQTLDEDALNALYAKGRLEESDLEAFPGLWQPVE